VWEARERVVKNVRMLCCLSDFDFERGIHDLNHRRFYLKNAIVVERRNLLVCSASRSGGVCDLGDHLGSCSAG
jgi:hypothetical protein